MADEPMREPTFLILAALAGGRLHGYGLIQTVQALSGGRVVLRPGTVYGALDRLENDGLVVDDGEETEQGRVRRYYRLTERGATVLGTETDRVAANAKVATSRLRRFRAGLA
jgi:PadR family transcriptional regulator PadR